MIKSIPKINLKFIIDKNTEGLDKITLSVNRYYGDIRLFYKKLISEFPFLIFPYLYGKKKEKGVSVEERNENIKIVFSVIAKYKDIVSSDYFFSFMVENSENWKLLSSKYFKYNDFHTFHKGIKDLNFMYDINNIKTNGEKCFC